MKEIKKYYQWLADNEYKKYLIALENMKVAIENNDLKMAMFNLEITKYSLKQSANYRNRR